jgi:hypothetical protein
MEAVRLNYTCISEIIQSELKFLSKLSELTNDERFKQSFGEVIYSLNDLSDTVNLQRRYLKPRHDAEQRIVNSVFVYPLAPLSRLPRTHKLGLSQFPSEENRVKLP